MFFVAWEAIVPYDSTWWERVYSNRRRIYIASRFRNKALVCSAGKILQNQGLIPVHSWTQETSATSRLQNALRDIHEIDEADAVLVLTEGCETVPGGMHFEAGYALGRKKRVAVVGPLVHIFYDLTVVEKYATIEDAAVGLSS